MPEKFIYYSTPIFRMLLFFFFIFLCTLPFGIIIQFEFITFAKDSIYAELFLKSAIVISVFGGLLMYFKTFPKIGFETVFITKKNMLIGFLKGSMIGIELIAFCALLLWLTGYVNFSKGSITPIILIVQLLYFIMVAVFEELIFRTLPLYLFAERFPIIVAILLNGLLFGALHMANPNFTWLAMVNISLAGSIFAIYTLQKRNISWAIGIHFAWNFTQGILFGYNVSGTENPSILLAKPMGNPYLSGGAFGIEGSVICTLILFVLLIYLFKKQQINTIFQQNVELKNLQNIE